MKKLNKLHITAITLIILGAGYFLAFNLIGSYVDENGLLHEPFGLIPIGYLLIFSGLILGIIVIIKSKFGKKQK